MKLEFVVMYLCQVFIVARPRRIGVST